MDKCYDRLDLAVLDLDHAPLVRAGYIRVKPPTLREQHRPGRKILPGRGK